MIYDMVWYDMTLTWHEPCHVKYIEVISWHYVRKSHGRVYGMLKYKVLGIRENLFDA